MASANAQVPAASDACAEPCAWVHAYGTGEGNVLRPGADADMRMASFVSAEPDGGALIAGMAFIDGQRGLWLGGLTPTGAIAWETVEDDTNLCRAAADGDRGLLTLTKERGTHAVRLSAYDRSGNARWSLPLVDDDDDLGAIAALPNGGTVAALGDYQAMEIVRIATRGFVFDHEAVVESRSRIPFDIAADVVPTAITALADGTLAVAGALTEAGSPPFVLALDADGQVLWRTDFEAAAGRPPEGCLPGSDTVTIAPLSDGGVVVNFFYVEEGGPPRSLLAALDAGGTVRWTWDPGDGDTEPTDHSLANAVAPTADGGMLIAGMTHRPMGQSRYWIARMAADATEEWRRTVSPRGEHTRRDFALASVTEMPDGGALAFGSSGLRIMRMQAWGIRLGPGGTNIAGRPVPQPVGSAGGAADIVGVWSARPGDDSIVVTFLADGTLLVLMNGDIERGSYTTDFTADPAHLDADVDGDRSLGLVEFLDDVTMRIAMGRDDGVRPVSLDDDRVELVTFRRMSPPPQRTVQPAPQQEALPPPAQEEETTPEADGTYPGSRRALMDMLAVVPGTLPEGTSVLPVSYVDFEALVGAAYGANPTGATTWPFDLDALVTPSMRIAAGPSRYLQNLITIDDEMPALLGVGVGDVRRGLEFGVPPAWAMVLGLDPESYDADAIRAALNARDLDQREVDGVTVWHRLEDGRIDIANRNPGDPFGGDIGQSSRVALLGSNLAGSAFWAIATAMVEAAGSSPSMADDPDTRALVGAVTAGSATGGLLQLYLIGHQDTMPVPARLLDLVQDGSVADLAELVPESALGPLPPYRLVALADRFVDGRDEAVIALPYASVDEAQTASGILADRVRRFDPPSRAGAWAERLDELGATIEPFVFEAEDGSRAIAGVRIGYPSVFPIGRSADDRAAAASSVFRFLVQAWHLGELTPLMIAE